MPMGAMSATPFADFDALPAARALRWFADGARLWRRAPIMLFLLAFVPLLVEGVVQLIPLAGMVLSKFITPLISFGLVIGLDALARGQRLRLSHLFSAFRHGRFPAAARLALWTMIVPAFQFAVATVIYGPAALDAVLFGHLLQHPELMTRAFSLWLILPGIPVATLFAFAPQLVLLRAIAPGHAVLLSARRVLAAPLAFSVVVLATIAILLPSLTTAWGALALLLLPWFTATGFAAWLDLVGVQEPESATTKALAAE
jgi:hypothetical protein